MENRNLTNRWADWDTVINAEKNPIQLVPAEDIDNFLGFGKKAKARRQAKKEARQEAKAQGLSRKEVRLAGRQAKKELKAEQGAGIFGGKFAARKAAKAGGKLQAISEGKTGKDVRVSGRAAKQEVIAVQKEAKADKKEAKGKTKRAEKLRSRAEKIRSLKGKSRVAGAAETAVLAPLLPLRKRMERMLKERGFNIPPRFADTAKLFYNEIVAEGRKGRYDAVPRMNFDAFQYHADDEDSDNVAGGALIAILSTIVKAIIDFFKSSKEKLEKGEPVSNIEKQAGETLAVVEAKIEKQAEAEAAQRVGEKILFDQNTWVVVGLVVVGIIVVTTSIARK